MTGEMLHINQNGKDNDGNVWELHAHIVRGLQELGYDATLQPFDQYQGPYILIGKDVRLGQRPYQLAVQNVGVVRLWISQDEVGLACIYREDTDAHCTFCSNSYDDALFCAKELIAHTWALDHLLH